MEYLKENNLLNISNQHIILMILNSLMITASPILIYTCQELFSSLP